MNKLSKYSRLFFVFEMTYFDSLFAETGATVSDLFFFDFFFSFVAYLADEFSLTTTVS